MIRRESLNDVADEVLGKDIPKTLPPRLPKVVEDNMRQLFDDLFRQPIPTDPRAGTLVVNLFAGPGTGKSTTAAGIFFELKTRHLNAELAAEYAKDLVWEKRNTTFDDQIYLFAKQYHRIFRLLGQVEVVVTDSPILLSPIYDYQKRPTLEKLVVEEHRKMWTYNVFLKRKKPYNPIGRLHGEDHALDIDRQILDLLDKHGECYEVFDADPSGKDKIVQKILLLLKNRLPTLPKKEKVVVVDFKNRK